jgi:hypothetical protein
MFEKSHRPGGELYTRLREDAPDWLRDAVYEAHDGEIPNDWRYDICSALWDEITDEGNGGMEAWEHSSGLADVYTGRLLDWLTPGRLHYIDTVLEEWNEIKSFSTILPIAQSYAIDRMAIILVDAYNDNETEVAA